MGREPTSLSCHTCRSRRIKCDLARPACARCTKSGRVCQGYEKLLRINIEGVVRSKKSEFSQLGNISRATSFPTKSAAPKKGARAKSQGQQKDAENEQLEFVARPPDSLPCMLDLSPFVDNVSLSYLFESYSWINMHSILLQDTPMRQYLIASTDELVYDSLRALSHGIFARDHQIDALKRTAGRIYGKSLQTLQSRLEVSSKKSLAYLVKAIALLGSYSITVEDDLRFTHHDGMARIMEHCGPEHFQAPELLPLFESHRMTLIASATVRRQATFLAREEWISVPWALNPELKTSHGKLLDIMTKLPGILQGIDDIVGRRERWIVDFADSRQREGSLSLAEMLRRVQDIILEIQRWRSEWIELNGSAASDVLEWASIESRNSVGVPAINAQQSLDIGGWNTVALPENDLSPWAEKGLNGPQATSQTFALMHEAVMYTTVCMWGYRLQRRLDPSCHSAECPFLGEAPLKDDCLCHRKDIWAARHPQFFPDMTDRLDPRASWNIYTPKIADSPIRLSPGSSDGIATSLADSVRYVSPVSSSASLMDDVSSGLGTPMLPGDIRFASQLQILNWLICHLPRSRAHVLGTLAAMGIGHCVHDTRPTEGREDIAAAVRGVMERSRFEGAAAVILKNYR